MNIINTITDEYFNLEIKEMNNPRIRYGARGIVLNKDNKIAILNKKYKNEYKLVGGGIEENEDPKTAFKREVLEEAGCNIEITDDLGIIEEIKTHDNFKQTSYVFVGKVIGEIKEPNFTQKELDEGSQILWLDINTAMKLIKECENKLIASQYENVYHTKFIVRRDYEILKYYKENYILYTLK